MQRICILHVSLYNNVAGFFLLLSEWLPQYVALLAGWRSALAAAGRPPEQFPQGVLPAYPAVVPGSGAIPAKERAGWRPAASWRFRRSGAFRQAERPRSLWRVKA